MLTQGFVDNTHPYVPNRSTPKISQRSCTICICITTYCLYPSIMYNLNYDNCDNIWDMSYRNHHQSDYLTQGKLILPDSALMFGGSNVVLFFFNPDL